MALISCHECGKEVSTEAKACQFCGAKPKPKISKSESNFTTYFILALFGVVVYGCMSNNETVDTSSYSASYPPSGSPIPLDSDAYIDEPFTRNGYKPLVLFVESIRARGNTCDSVNTARISAWDGTYVISCNNLAYEYEFKDVGGNIEMTVVR